MFELVHLVTSVDDFGISMHPVLSCVVAVLGGISFFIYGTRVVIIIVSGCMIWRLSMLE